MPGRDMRRWFRTPSRDGRMPLSGTGCRSGVAGRDLLPNKSMKRHVFFGADDQGLLTIIVHEQQVEVR